MVPTFDRRIVGDRVLGIVLACQCRIPSHLGGGAALAGAYLRHRLSNDADLFFDTRQALREMVAQLPEVASETNTAITIARDAGTYVRVAISPSEAGVEMDLVFDPAPRIAPAETLVEGVVVESLADLRANKLTCILSRSEPRDLVDLLFLDRAGFPPERDLELALRKDAGLDPSILAWLLGQFPVAPMPQMLVPLTPAELMKFRDDLRQRLRQAAIPSERG